MEKHTYRVSMIIITDEEGHEYPVSIDTKCGVVSPSDPQNVATIMAGAIIGGGVDGIRTYFEANPNKK